MTVVRLTLPEPPSVNRLWRKARGRMYLHPKAKAYYEAVLRAVQVARITKPPFPDGPVRYDLTWYRSRKVGDLSNRLKAFEDSLNGLVWTDDKQVVSFTCRRVDGQRPGRVEVTVERAA